MQYTWVAEDYFQNSQFQYEHAQQALSLYQFSGNESVLDVGCGDGKITAKIAETLPNGDVIGIDSSEHMIHFANVEFLTAHSNLKFFVNKAEAIPYINQFDLITSFACLHWVKNQLGFLQSAKSALKSNGKIILTLYPKHPYIWESIEEATALAHWREYFIGYENPHISYNTQSYQSLCDKANLRVAYLEEKTPIAYFQNRESMESFLRSWLPHADQVHPHLRQKFLHDIGTIFLKKISYKNTDELIGMPFRRMDAILCKE